MILTCENCQTRYLVPQHSIGADGRTVRCTNCEHEWFQEPEDMPAPPENFEPLPEIEPIPEAVMPIPEDSGLPAIPEEVLAPPRERRTYPRAAGYLAAAVVCVAVAAGLYYGRLVVASLWPPAALLYEMAGLSIPVPGEGLIFDRLKAAVTVDEKGVKTLNVEGVIVNLKEHEMVIPPVHVSLLQDNGTVFDNWRLEIAQATAPAGADVAFSATYPAVPNDVKEVSVSFRSGTSKNAAPVVPVTAAAEEGAKPEPAPVAEELPAPPPSAESQAQEPPQEQSQEQPVSGDITQSAPEPAPMPAETPTESAAP